MKARLSTLFVPLLLAAGVVQVAQAQGTNPPVNADRPPSGQPPIPERPTIIPPEVTPDPNTPARPVLPGQTTPSTELRDLVKGFQTAREAFLQQQQDLLAQLKAATKEDREAVRQQLKENLDAWLEQQKAQMQDIRDQAREIKNNVPAIRDVVESGTGEGRGR